MYKNCPDCLGTGYSSDEELILCENCGGTGIVEDPDAERDQKEEV